MSHLFLFKEKSYLYAGVHLVLIFFRCLKRLGKSVRFSILSVMDVKLSF